MPHYTRVIRSVPDFASGTLTTGMIRRRAQVEQYLTPSWSLQYAASVLPQNDTPAWTRSTGGTVEAEEIVSGELHLQTNDATDYIFYLRSSVVTAGNVTTVEADVRVISSSTGSFPASIEIADGSKAVQVNLFSDHVELRADVTVPYYIDMTTTRTVRLVKNGTTSAHLYIDGVEVLERPGLFSRAANRIFFGHADSGDYAETYWDFVYYSLSAASQAYAASTVWESPEYNLAGVGTGTTSSAISWTATTPVNTSITVETNRSLDGGSTWGGWQSASSGGAINGITSGTDLSQGRLLVKVTLATTDTTVTADLQSLTIDIQGAAPGDAWDAMTAIGAGLSLVASATVGDNIYIIGGNDGVSSPATVTTHTKYDTAADSYTALTAVPSARQSAAAAAVGTDIYVLGGVATSLPTTTMLVRNDKYDTVTDAWTTKTDLPAGREGLGAAVVSGNIYFGGGRGGQVGSTSERPFYQGFWRYNVSADTYDTLTDLPGRDWAFPLFVANGTDIFMVTGIGQQMMSGKLIIYDTVAATFTAKEAAPNAGHAVFGGIAKGQLIVAGGGYWEMSNGSFANTATLAKTASYLLSANVWRTMTDITTARYGGAYGVVSNKLYAITGQNAAGTLQTANQRYTPRSERKRRWVCLI